MGSALLWKKRGWPKWAMYEPVAQAAMDARLKMVPLGLSKKKIREISKRGLEVLDDNLYRELGLNRSLPKRVRIPFMEDLREAHCYKISNSALFRMVNVQRARDAYMAKQATLEAKKGSIVLITGAGHARKEWGIPRYLRILAKKARITSVALMEVRDDYVRPKVYVDSAAPFDYIWFTPAVDALDPCIRFEKQLRKMKMNSKKRAAAKRSKKSKKRRRKKK